MINRIQIIIQKIKNKTIKVKNNQIMNKKKKKRYNYMIKIYQLVINGRQNVKKEKINQKIKINKMIVKIIIYIQEKYNK